MRETVVCEVCGKDTLTSVLQLGNHPLCDDLVPIGNNRVCQEYTIEILLCDTCLTGHQRFQVPKEVLFQKHYHYRARVTGSVLAGMADVVASCEERYGSLAGKTVLDVGCNDGSLLNFFKAKGAHTLGVEPTAAALESHHETINRFFDEKACAEIKTRTPSIDFITFTNVFAHIEDLPALIRNVRSLCSPSTVVIIENHYLGAILQTGQFDTFYHEHPRTYSLRSFVYIARNLGLNLEDFQFTTRYGGNVRVYLGNGAIRQEPFDESHLKTAFAEIAQEMSDWRTSTRKMIETMVAEHGKLRAKAFPGRAAILMKLLGVNEKHFSALYEIKGSIKVGHYVPGTRIPILPEAELFQDPDLTKPIVNFAWHIAMEVENNLRANGYTGEIVHIKTAKSQKV
jgi:SAM-dependent methyltransferase